jgi:hypothetical protein
MGEFGPRFHARNARFFNENVESQSFGTAFSKICDFKSRGIKLEATPPILKTHFLKQF